MTLPVIQQSFVPANNRPWLVRFWELDAMYVGIACPFGLILFILFYFDANVSVSLGRTRLKIVSHRSRVGIPFAKASWVPLGLFPAGSDDVPCWIAWTACSERLDPAGATSHC
jgi:hypothetical protein